MKKLLSKSILAATLVAMAAPATTAQDKVTGWGDWKLYLDPGHSGRENQGMWGYSEAQKTLRVALTIQEFLQTYTDMPEECLKICRYDDNTTVALEERSDAANAWGADFYYSIHSDAGATENSIVLLFGGWRKNGVDIEKTPNGGKAYGEILNPNLSGAMQIPSRGNWYDRCFYEGKPENHNNQYPYLSVNRRSNMPSLLSEGGYHTIAAQQQRNINDQYKRLEAFAAFQSLLQYHGVARPAQTFLTGVVSNSENGQPLNGATVTVGDKTYTTDTWETAFKPYTNNPDLIHNGFYLFEGLKAGETVEVKFECEGYEPLTTTATIKGGKQDGTTPDYITFLDVALTNIAPAKVASISLTDLDAVTPLQPLAITFTRNMDRKSVEDAFSINHNGKVELSWANDYTLLVDLSQLLPEWDYTITIDGSIAKNSATGQLLDGNGDGAEGGNYTLTFTMAEPDLEAPVIAQTYPADGGEAAFDQRPVIGIEFNEEVNWNEDTMADFVTVVDAFGKVYPGKLIHSVILGKSFLQYYLDQNLPLDRTFLVTLKAGVPDMYGNTTDKDSHFRFMSEYRRMKESQMLQDMNEIANWWAPGGSGSTKGIIIDDSSIALSNMTCSTEPENTGSMEMTYVFDIEAATPLWNIREYWTKGNSIMMNEIENCVLRAHVYGDASNNSVSIMARVKSSNGLNHGPQMPIDFRGWRPLIFDLNGEFEAFTGDGSMSAPIYIDSFFMIHEDIDPDDEEIPFQEWDGKVYFDNLMWTKWDYENSERNANIEDIAIPESGVANITVENGAISFDGSYASVATTGTVYGIEVYNLAGARVASAKASRVNVTSLSTGVYVVRALTSAGTINAKIVK